MKAEKEITQKLTRDAGISVLLHLAPIVLMFTAFYITDHQPWAGSSGLPFKVPGFLEAVFKNLSSWGLPVIVLAIGVIEFLAGMYENKWTKNESTLDIICFIVPKIIVRPVVTYFSLQLLPHLLPNGKDIFTWVPFWWAFVIIAVADDLTQYWYHRIHHQLPWLWRFHRTHHSAPYMGMAMASRQNIIYTIFFSQTYLTAALTFVGLGYAALFVKVIKSLIVTGAHSSIPWDKPFYTIKWLNPIGWVLERLISTPATHQAHHADTTDDGVGYYKGNFGNMFFLWDIIFGTGIITRKYPSSFGIKHYKEEEWYAQFLWPILKSKKEGSELSANGPMVGDEVRDKKKFYPLWLLGALLLIFSQVKAQDVITGLVKDDSGQGLPGVTIVEKGSSRYALTDVDGKFSIAAAKEFPFTIQINMTGFQTQEIEIYELTTEAVEVTLKTANLLDEVVVVGYGEQKRKDITGSVASVPIEIKSQPVASVERLLQGSVAGAVVTQTSGQPGGGVSVQIRGNNSITAGSDPLYVIDGFPINNDYSLNDAGVTTGSKINPLSSLNTADIENIDVLKDASATAIYGSRGANGVVIITTKTGSKNKSSINYDAFYGTQEVIRTLPLLNAGEWWSLRKDAAINSGKTPTIPSVQGYSLDTTGAGTDWQAAAFRKASQQSHNLSILSGSDKTRLAVSGNYFKQNGILQNTDFRRYSARVNVDHQYNDRFRILANLNASNIKSNVAPASIITNLLQTPPALPIYQNDGSFVINSPFESALQNPINSLYNQLNETITNRFLGNISGEYTIIDGLKAKILVGADVVGNKQNRYLPSTTAEGQALSGNAIVGTVSTTSWLNENTLSYDKDIDDKNRVNAVVGFTAQTSESKATIAEAAGFATDAFSYNNLATGITSIAPRSAANGWSLASYLGRINYAFDDRYLVTFTLRADGSSRFGEGNKWGYFPSAAFGWNLNNEKFFQQFKKISLLKLRVSAGTTGNQSIPPYQSLSQLAYFRYNFSNTTVSGYAPNTVPNPDLGWEKTFQVDAGFDLGLFKNRLNIIFDYYYKRTSDLLLTRTVAGSSGLSDFYNGQASTIYQNIGEVSNQGIELYVNSQNTTGAFKWNTIFIFARNTNKILSLGGGVNQIIPNINMPSIAKVGYPLGSFITYQADGIIQQGETPLTPQQNKSPGGQKYKDVNGDGIITQTGDRVIVSNQPGFTTGLTNTFNYKGFDLMIFFQASIGGKLYNQNRANLELATGYVNGSDVLLNRWTPTNTNTDVKAAFQDPAITISDRFIEDATYYRLKNLSLGYNIPKALLSKIKIETLRVYVSAQNPVTWTKYTGYDPEVSLNGQSLINKGVDSGVYPNNRSYQVGLSLSF